MWELVRKIALFLLMGVVSGVMVFWWVRNSEDPPRKLITKWIASLFFLAGIFFAKNLAYMLQEGKQIGIMAPMLVVLCGIGLAALWTSNIVGFLARPLTSAFDGGNAVSDPAPFYGLAKGLRKERKYDEAEEEIQKQLQRFPGDFDGTLLLAEIKAVNRRDLPTAAALVESLTDLEVYERDQVGKALNSLAIWYETIGKNPEAATVIRLQMEQLVPDYMPIDLRMIDEIPEEERAATKEKKRVRLASVPPPPQIKKPDTKSGL